MAHVSFRNIAKSFGAVIALRDVNLAIEKGEVRALLGGNGSGKSTLARIIGGSVYPDAGEILINGQNVNIDSPITALKHKISATSQELSLFPDLSVEQNLTLLNAAKKAFIFKDRVKSRGKALEALSKVGLRGIIDNRVSELPDDEKYLVEFAKALLNEPEILIVDEITSALFREEVDIVRNIIKDLSQKGCCILFISHRLQDIYSICSSVTVLRNGTVVNTYQVGEVKEQTLLEDMIGDTGPKKKGAGSAALLKNSNTNLLAVGGLKIPGFKGSEVSFQVRKGEILGIAGLKGQGQSKLLQLLFGMHGPISVSLNGEELKIESPRKAIRKGIAFLTGDRVLDGIFMGRSISENLEVVNNIVFKRNQNKAEEILDQYNVRYTSAAQPIETLSGGNQQKVVIARWTSTQPRILLADDPTKGIDVAARKDVYDIFLDLAMTGSAVIFVSSDDEELARIRQITDLYRVCIMYAGRIVQVLEGEDITISNIISASLPRGEENGHFFATDV